MFFRLGEECSNVAQEIAPVIENVANFSTFSNPLTLKSLWSGNFFGLADNGFLGCTVVVCANSRKWGHLGGRGSVRCDWLVGLFQDILAEGHTYYNHYAIEFAFKKAMNLDTMAVVYFAISACK
ncbi:MAG: hypothetical protein ABUK14_07780 [Desulfobacteria bacterium]